MISLKPYLLFIGLLLVLINAIFFINTQSQLFFFIPVMMLTGIPHGALDYFVAKETQLQVDNKPLHITKFLLKYLLNMGIYSIIWLALPTLGFIIFIGLTAFHFGEVDWPIRQHTKLDATLYTIFGLQILVFIITSHMSTALPIITSIINLPISVKVWVQVGHISLIISCVSLLISLLLLAIFYKKLGWTIKVILQFAAQTIILLAIVSLLPLYLAFGFYFGIWHSLLSFNLIRLHLHLPNNTKGWLQMIKKALPYAIVAWLGIGGLIFAGSKLQQQMLVNNLGTVFIAISILTLPHLQVFTKLGIRKNQLNIS